MRVDADAGAAEDEDAKRQGAQPEGCANTGASTNQADKAPATAQRSLYAQAEMYAQATRYAQAEALHAQSAPFVTRGAAALSRREESASLKLLHHRVGDARQERAHHRLLPFVPLQRGAHAVHSPRPRPRIRPTARWSDEPGMEGPEVEELIDEFAHAYGGVTQHTHTSLRTARESREYL